MEKAVRRKPGDTGTEEGDPRYVPADKGGSPVAVKIGRPRGESPTEEAAGSNPCGRHAAVAPTVGRLHRAVGQHFVTVGHRTTHVRMRGCNSSAHRATSKCRIRLRDLRRKSDFCASNRGGGLGQSGRSRVIPRQDEAREEADAGRFFPGGAVDRSGRRR